MNLPPFGDEELRAAMAYMAIASAPAPIRDGLRTMNTAMAPWPWATDSFVIADNNSADARLIELNRAKRYLNSYILRLEHS